MTNMRDKVKPPREPKVKFQTKTRSYYLKAKDKLNDVSPKPIKRHVLVDKNSKKDSATLRSKPKPRSPVKVGKQTVVPKNNAKRKKSGDVVKEEPSENNLTNEAAILVDESTLDSVPNGQHKDKNDVFIRIKKENSESSAKPRNHKCDVCGKAFLGKNDLRKHSLIHADLKPYACNHCGRGFRQAGNLRNHITSYHSNVIENPSVYICDHCHKAFLIKERLRLHLRTHTGYKPYRCSQCPKRFARLGQVKQHSIVHSGDRNYACPQCKATFSCSAKLKLHIKGHNDIRDHTCYLCGKSFIRPDAIKKHLACFHNNEKPFQCPICNKPLKGHLQEHLRTHKSAKPHGCAECGSRFAQRSQLTVHQRTHTGARPYRCRVCWRAFAHSTALKLHTRRHTGEKPFSCYICFMSFAQLPHMKKHMQCIHGELRIYCHKACNSFFRTQRELEKHISQCSKQESSRSEDEEGLSPEERLSRQVAAAHLPVDPPMALTKMRLLLAVLLKKISSNKRLEELGFNKRLIDDILIDSLESSGHSPCKDTSYSPAEKLKINVQLLLEWTVPSHFMKKFRNEQRSTEELLEELTS